MATIERAFREKDFATFANTVSFDAIRLTLAYAAEQNYELHTIDVRTAYLNAELEEGFAKRLEIERERAGGDARRDAIKNHIIERILTLSCQRCGQAWTDFSGCEALTCGRCRAGHSPAKGRGKRGQAPERKQNQKKKGDAEQGKS